MVTGPVEKFLTILPKTININGKEGSEGSGVATLIPEEKFPFKIISSKLNKGKNLDLDVSESKQDGKTVYSVKVTSDKEASGNFYDKVLIDTDSKIKPLITVWVSVRLQKKAEPIVQSTDTKTESTN